MIDAFRQKLPRTTLLVLTRSPPPSVVPQGPGLAIRIIGDVTREKLDILRQADVILIDELHKNGIYREIAQVRTNLPPSPTPPSRVSPHPPHSQRKQSWPPS